MAETYQVTLIGFDGGSDLTDDHVKWISAESVDDARARAASYGWDIQEDVQRLGRTRDFEPMDDPQFTNHYDCPCGVSWQYITDCMCDDRCPACDNSISPSRSENKKHALVTRSGTAMSETVLHGDEVHDPRKQSDMKLRAIQSGDWDGCDFVDVSDNPAI